MAKAKPIPVRDPSATTFTWSLPKRLKAELIVVADRDGRPLSNYLTHALGPIVEAQLRRLGVELSDKEVEATLEAAAEKAFRGLPGTRKS